MDAKSIRTTNQTSFGMLHILIALLTLATAFIHFSLLFPDLLFILNGLGYLTLLAAYFLPLSFLRQNHALVRYALMGFIVVTILGWVAIGDKSWPAGALGYATKLIELVLLSLLWVDKRRS